METTADQARFSSNLFGRHRHICAFFNSFDEQHRVLRPFIRDGFADGDKAYHYVDPRRGKNISAGSPTGVNVDEAMSTGQLEVRPWEESTLRGGQFDVDWLATFEEVLQSGRVRISATRFFGHMEWALDRPGGYEDLIEYETRSTTSFRSNQTR